MSRTRHGYAAQGTNQHDEVGAFTLATNGPPVPVDEVERDDREMLHVVVSWDGSVIATRFLDAEGAVFLGDRDETRSRSFRRQRLESIRSRWRASARRNSLSRCLRKPVATIEDAAEARSVRGPSSIETTCGQVVRIWLGNFHVQVSHERAGRKPEATSFVEQIRRGAFSQIGAAALAHAACSPLRLSTTPGLLGDDGGASSGIS